MRCPVLLVCLLVAAAVLLPHQVAHADTCENDCVIKAVQCQNNCGADPDCQKECAIQEQMCFNKCESFSTINGLALQKKKLAGAASDAKPKQIAAAPFAFPIGETCADNCLISSVQCQNICADDHECQVGCATVYDRCIANCTPPAPPAVLRDTCENDCVIKAVQCQNNCGDDHDCQLECAAQKQMCFNKCESFKAIDGLRLHKKKLAGATKPAVAATSLAKKPAAKSPFLSLVDSTCTDACLATSTACQDKCGDDDTCINTCEVQYNACLSTCVTPEDTCKENCLIKSVQCQNRCADDPTCQQDCATTYNKCVAVCEIVPVAIVWSHLNATTLAALTPDEMSTAAATDLAVIPAAACAGFNGAQLAVLGVVCSGFTLECLAAIPSEQWATVTPTCLSQFGAACTGITAASWTAIDEATFSGLSSNCAMALNADSFSAISAEQFTQVTPQALAGFPAATLAKMQPKTCAGFSSLGIKALATVAFGAFTADQVPFIPAAALAGASSAQIATWTTACTGLLPIQLASFEAIVCSGLIGQCVNSIQVDAIPGIQAVCIGALTQNAAEGFTLEQLAAIPAVANAGWVTLNLLALYQAFGQPLIDNWSAEQANSISKQVVLTFASFVDEGQVKTGEKLTATTDLSKVSSLQLAICSETPADCLDALFASADTPNLLPALSWMGLRVTHVLALGSAGGVRNVGWLNASDSWSHWPSISINRLSAAQVASIASQSFAGINPGRLSLAGFSALSNYDIVNVPATVWAQLPCTHFHALSFDQEITLQAYAADAYSTLEVACAQAASSSGAAPAEASSTGESHDTDKHTHGLSHPVVIGIAVGSAVIGLILGAVLILCCIRKKRRQRQGLDEAFLSANA